MIDRKKFFERCHELTEFCLANRGKCFRGWTKEKVFFYCGFHLLSETLFVSSFNGKVNGVAIAFPMKESEIDRPFDWKIPTAGNALMIYDVVGSRDACRDLFRQATVKWPFVNRFFTHRRGELSEYNPGFFARI